MDASTRRRFSVLLYDALNQQGYSSHRIKHRSKNVSRTFEIVSDCNFRNGVNVKFIAAGSFGEGISKVFASDVDVMCSPCDITCVDEVSHGNETSDFVFQNEYANTSPGYVRLYTDRAVSCVASSCPFLISQRCVDLEKHYLNSKLTMKEFCKSELTAVINGPAITFDRLKFWSVLVAMELGSAIVELHQEESDLVLALPFFSANILDKWERRERHYEWPSRSLQSEISTMAGYAVSVGHKFSQNKDIEWRISYTTAEKKLVDSMNDVQVKVYAVLKFVQKDRLKPICKNFTSYMVKNLVFWVLEQTPVGDLTPETLIDRIMSAFHHLKQCLENNFLPCYMIPERNLFDGRMDQMECILLLGEVENIINEGYKFLLKNHRLSLSMQLTYSYPEIARGYAQWLVEVEDLWLECSQLRIEHIVPSMLENGPSEVFLEEFTNFLEGVEGEAVHDVIRRLLQLLGLDHYVTSEFMVQDPTEFMRLFFTRAQDALS